MLRTIPIVALIQKVQCLFTLGDYRPVSLLGCLYKILAKILTAKLSTIMDGLITHVQSAFVKGRNLVVCVLVANGVIDFANKRRKECFSYKVDFEKTYDSITWSFLDYMLKRFGFDDRRRAWMRACVFSGNLYVLVNESPLRSAIRGG